VAQFDVYRLASGLALDVQTDLLGDFPTRVVVPLLPDDKQPVPHKRLNPTLLIAGVEYRMGTQFASAMRARDLGRSVANLKDDYDPIKAAMDMLFNGF
jgi:toxin CcdB